VTSTGIIRTALQEPHAHHDPHLVPTPRPPVRRLRRSLHLHLSRAGITPRIVLLGSTPAAAWTAAMIALALAVRY
jgi:hypothetical protein